jgi:hypothetical protein
MVHGAGGVLEAPLWLVHLYVNTPHAVAMRLRIL